MAGDDTNHRGRQSFAVLFDRGDEIVVQASDDGIRFLFVSGQPLEKPVALVRADSDKHVGAALHIYLGSVA